MTFYEAMSEVLQTSRYDRLMDRLENNESSNWLRDLLDRIFSGRNIYPTSFNYDTNVLTAVFAIAGAIIVIIIAILLYYGLRNTNKPEKHYLGDIFEELANNNYTVAQLVKISDNASERRTAIRYRYIAALLSLNEREIIEIKPSATNAIIKYQIIQESPNLLPSFECTANTFQYAWFGYKNINDETFYEFVEAVDHLIKGGEEHA